MLSVKRPLAARGRAGTQLPGNPICAALGRLGYLAAPGRRKGNVCRRAEQKVSAMSAEAIVSCVCSV